MARNAQTDSDDERWDESIPQAKPVGTKVWYCLRPSGEWVQAVVVGNIDGTELEPPLEDGQLHLKVRLNRKRHGSSSTIGYRMNVPQGNEKGQWLEEKPENADEDYQRSLEREQMLMQARREEMLKG